MQMDFTASLSFFDRGYEWYDSEDYSMQAIGFPGKFRPKNPAAQRRLRCRGTADDIELGKFVEFDPFKSARGMFLEFAELDGSEEAILEFTNRYGRLWNDFSGPSLEDYREASEDLWDAVQLWLAVQDRDNERLNIFLQWDKAGRLRWKSALAKPIKHNNETIHFVDVKYGRRQYRPGDLIGPATDLLDFVIHTRPTWDMHIKPIRRNGVMSLQLEVRDLLYVLWVQFALAVAGNKVYERCQFCGRPFELAPQVNRADRLFCSDNCRVKAYQRRKKQALAMWLQGQSVRAIAKATNSDTETLKKWIAESETKEQSGDKKTQRKR